MKSALCGCGCGEMPPAYDQTNYKRGMVRGEHAKFLKGHNCRMRPFESLYVLFKRVAKKAKHSVELSYEDFLKFTKKRKCRYCGCKLKWAMHNPTRNGCSYNLDRKNNSLGYTKKNCVACCGECNRIKGARFTYKELMLLSPVLRKIQKLRKEIAV